MSGSLEYSRYDAVDAQRPRPILHVITCLDVGGAELALKRLVLSDRSAASRHVVASLRDVGIVGRELQAAGITVREMGMTRNPFAMVTGFVRLLRLIRSTHPAVIQTWMYHADLFGGLAGRLAGRSEIAWGVRQSGFSREDSALTKGVMRLCARLSTLVPRVIVCPAEAARTAHISWGYSADKMRVIRNGFDVPDLASIPSRRRAMRERLGLADQECAIGMVARFDPLKDHEGFVQAAAIVARRHPSARFVLVGRGVEESNERLVEWIRQARLQDKVLLLGERRDVEDCLAALDVFCMPSIHEGFPNVVAEAMSMSVPCVVTDAGDAAYIVGDTGKVVPVRKPAELADAIAEVVSLSAAQRRALGTAARHRIETTFSTSTTLVLFEQAWSAALSREA